MTDRKPTQGDLAIIRALLDHNGSSGEATAVSAWEYEICKDAIAMGTASSASSAINAHLDVLTSEQIQKLQVLLMAKVWEVSG